MAFLPTPFNIKPVQLPKLHEAMDYYNESFEVFLSNEQVYVDWRDSDQLQIMNLQIESEKDEQWARLFDKSFERLKNAEAKSAELELVLLQNQKLSEEVRLLKSQIFGASSEKSDKNADLATNDEIENSPEQPIQTKQKKQRDPESYTGRKRLPEHIPRDEIIYDIPEDERKCTCCDGKIHFVGEEVTEKTTTVPSEVRVEKSIQYKYVCHKCDIFHYAKKPKTMLRGSNFDHPSFLADVIVKKVVLGMPYYRMQQHFSSMGAPINRGTISTTVCKIADRLFPLMEGLRATLLTQNVIHADETPIQVLKEPGRKPQTQSFMWLYISGKHEKNPITLFDYQQTRSGQHPKNFLSDANSTYEGYLMVDGYAGYNKVPKITKVGCMAHLRRYFDKALKALPKNISGSNAEKAIDMINELYHIEKSIKDQPPDKIFKIRNELSVPLLNNLKKWLDEMKLTAVPKMLFGQAINYALAQWQFVSRYISNGELPIDNNAAERAIKQIVIGRKNWLFADSVDGAYANAVIYSLVGTAIANGLDPYKYLLHVFEKFPNMERSEDISILFPWNMPNCKLENKMPA